MDRELAARIIQRAWTAYRDELMAAYYAEQYERDNEVSWADMYPERPADYDAMDEVHEMYCDLYNYGY